MTVKNKSSPKPKIVMTVRIDDETWTNFRKRCIENNEKYSHRLETILRDYLKYTQKIESLIKGCENNEQKNEKGNAEQE
jgi:hypothetical protein